MGSAAAGRLPAWLNRAPEASPAPPRGRFRPGRVHKNIGNRGDVSSSSLAGAGPNPSYSHLEILGKRSMHRRLRLSADERPGDWRAVRFVRSRLSNDRLKPPRSSRNRNAVSGEAAWQSEQVCKGSPPSCEESHKPLYSHLRGCQIQDQRRAATAGKPL